jgi:hypothetical protein
LGARPAVERDDFPAQQTSSPADEEADEGGNVFGIDFVSEGDIEVAAGGVELAEFVPAGGVDVAEGDRVDAKPNSPRAAAKATGG